MAFCLAAEFLRADAPISDSDSDSDFDSDLWTIFFVFLNDLLGYNCFRYHISLPLPLPLPLRRESRLLVFRVLKFISLSIFL